MEAYIYSNIFDTKGIEYIIIIFFLLLLIPFWIVVNRKSEAVVRITKSIKAFTASVLSTPKGLFFSRNHTWLQLEKSGEARIGIDDFLIKVLGDVVVHPLKSPGDDIKKGEPIAFIEQAGKELKMHSPVSGKITGFNSAIIEEEAAFVGDPYGEGWLFTLQPDSWKAETAGYLLGDESESWMEGELQRLKDFLNVTFSRNSDPSMLLVYQEGGELQMNPLSNMEVEVWDDFQNEFLEQTG